MKVQFEKVASRTAEIAAIAKDMEAELGSRNTYPEIINKMAQLELAIMDWYENNKGACNYAVFANKCWPAWQPVFEFEPCYVNSRLTGRGIPVACEVDLYGALSEFMAECATEKPATLLDINNSVPADVIPAGANLAGADLKDLYMGFHCGNTCSSCMKSCEIKYQLIQARLMSPDITKGTLEGQIAPGKSTMFRIQSNSDSKLVSYIAQGEFLDVDPCSFGGIGIHAIPGFARFYRHVLVGKRFPHHGAYAFDHCGKVLFEALRLLGVEDINTPLPAGQLYPGENPFAI
jgi:L-fucose isomerase-like protein